jgi:hypothetical protein
VTNDLRSSFADMQEEAGTAEESGGSRSEQRERKEQKRAEGAEGAERAEGAEGAGAFRRPNTMR